MVFRWTIATTSTTTTAPTTTVVVVLVSLMVPRRGSFKLLQSGGGAVISRVTFRHRLDIVRTCEIGIGRPPCRGDVRSFDHIRGQFQMLSQANGVEPCGVSIVVDKLLPQPWPLKTLAL